jgi:hypothetical protein
MDYTIDPESGLKGVLFTYSSIHVRHTRDWYIPQQLPASVHMGERPLTVVRIS